MKALKATLCTLVILSMLLCFTACGGPDISGKYELVRMESADQVIQIEEMAQYMGEELNLYLQLNPDGTGILSMQNQTTNMRYEDGLIWEEGDEENKVVFTVEENILTMSQDGITLVFQK